MAEKENNVKENWKDTGKELGGAFKKFGKTFLRSARTIVDKADDKCNKDEETTEKVEESKEEKKESTVFNDGSWRETGKGLGHAFGSLGKSIGHTFTGERNEEKKDD